MSFSNLATAKYPKTVNVFGIKMCIDQYS